MPRADQPPYGTSSSILTVVSALMDGPLASSTAAAAICLATFPPSAAAEDRNQKISAVFSPVTDFLNAKCKQHIDGTCKRGGYCNYMHVKPLSKSFKK
jgi:hypothetical protein